MYYSVLVGVRPLAKRQSFETLLCDALLFTSLCNWVPRRYHSLFVTPVQSRTPRNLRVFVFVQYYETCQSGRRDGWEFGREALGQVRRGGEEGGARGQLGPFGQPEVHEQQAHVVVHRVRLLELVSGRKLGGGRGPRRRMGRRHGRLVLRHNLLAASASTGTPAAPLARPLAAQRPPLERAVEQPHAALARSVCTHKRKI